MGRKKKNQINDKPFWTLIEETRAESKDLKRQLALLKKRLKEVPDSALIEYYEALKTWSHRCDIGPLADAMLIMYGYISDDTFEYWRAALLMHGKKVVEDAMRDPETLADQDYFEPLERHLYIVPEECERRFGEEEGEGFLDSAEPEIDWSLEYGQQSKGIEEALKAYPRLTAKFWEKHGKKQFEKIYLNRR
jgi:hypothetical protein